MRFPCLLGLALLAPGLCAQSFYVPAGTVPSAGTVNAFPFNTSDMRYQALILASDLGGLPGVIHGFGLAPSSTGIRTFTSVTMKMAHVTTSTLSTTFDQNLVDPMYPGGSLTTMSVTNWSWPLTADTWNDVDLQRPFFYNGTDNVVVEFTVLGSGGAAAGMRREGTNQRVYQSSYTGQLTGSTSTSAFKMRVNFGDASYAAFGSGCPGSNNLTPALTYAGSSQFGQVLDNQLSQAAPVSVAFLEVGFYIPNIPYPLDLGVYGFPGCLLYFPAATHLATVADPNGNGSIPLGVPNNPNLGGTTFYTQWVVLDTMTANLSVSNYGRVQIGL